MSLSILVVDDEKNARENIAAFLKKKEAKRFRFRFASLSKSSQEFSELFTKNIS